MPIIDSMRMKRIGVTLSPCARLVQRQPDEASELLGIGSSACMVVPSRSRLSSTPTVMPPFWMKGNGCEGSTARGVRMGRYWEMNWRSSHSRSRGPQLLGLDDVDAGDGHLGPQRRKARLLVAAEAGGEAVDLDQLLGGRQPVLAHLRDAGGDLAVEAGHAHHVELVEVGGGDRQEAQALEQRVAGILRLFQNPPIELQPGQLAIGEASRALRRWPAQPGPRPPSRVPSVSSSARSWVDLRDDALCGNYATDLGAER